MCPFNAGTFLNLLLQRLHATGFAVVADAAVAVAAANAAAAAAAAAAGGGVEGGVLLELPTYA